MASCSAPQSGAGNSPGALSTSTRREFNRIRMGVQCRIVLYESNEERATQAADAAFHEIARLEELFSDYRPSSELSKLGEHAGAGPRAGSPEMIDILSTASTVSQATQGAFDITCGPAVALWREARKTGELPNAQAVAQARSLVDWQAVTIDPNAKTLALTRAGMRLDLGGIAKGYAAAKAAAVLASLGERSCLVGLAGDIAAGDPPPGTEGWRVTVTGDHGSAGPTVLLAHASVSTSGDAAQFVEIAGRRYSHIIDPRTGLGTSGGIQATVVSRDGALADALPKGVCINGAGAAVALAAQFHVAFIINDHGTWTTVDPEHVLHVISR